MTHRLLSSFRQALALCVLLLGTASIAHAQVLVDVSGNTASAAIVLPGDIGADLTITFESTQNLSAAKLGITAQLVDVSASGLLARLPDSLLVSVPAAFPLLITVEPSADFSFTNSYLLSVHTHNLGYAPGTPLRLFKAPLGGNFVDITEYVRPGSVDTGGREGGFSQFLIVADLRPNSIVAAGKFGALNTRIANAAMPALLRTQLNATLASAQTAFNANDYVSAIAYIDSFRSQVQAAAGTNLANVWRAARDLDNTAGSLDGMASTLRFTLTRLRDFGF
jgi:hypothetical protein